MKRILLAIGLLMPMLITAQIGRTDTTAKKGNSFQFGIKANAGISFITYHFDPVFFSNISYSNIPQLAFNVGVYSNYLINNKSSFGIEVLFMQMKGLIDITIEDLYYHFYYLSIPLEYFYKISNLKLCFGIQTSLMLSNREDGFGLFLDNGATFTYDNESKNLNFIKYDIGPKLGLFYDVTNRLFLDMDFYYGLNNHFINPIGNSSLKNQQITFGIGYKLY
jgi:hypothetical protein